MIPKSDDMRFEVTTRCNYNCQICPRDKITRKIETMSFELFKRLFDKIRQETSQYNTLTFPGMGEPLLDKTLDKKIEYAKKQIRNLDVLVLTNGFFLTPKRFKELENLGVNSARISFYGLDPLSYSMMHGVNSTALFKQVANNLVRISQIKTSTKLLLTLNVLDEVNGHSVEEWIRFWKDKADLIEVWRPHNWVYGRNYRPIQKSKLKTCGRPFRGPLQIQVDGTVNMCCFDFDGKLTIGDLKTESLKEIFSSALYRKIAACHKTGDFGRSGLICKDCDQRNKDRRNIIVYNSKFDYKERVRTISTTYKKII